MLTVIPNKPHLRGDVIIHPGGLCLCSDSTMRRQGVIGDNSITCPTCTTLVRRAAYSDGFAALAAEATKDRTYNGRFNVARWRVSPIVQEVYGRLGRRAGALFKQIAHHSAQVTGGTPAQIRERQGYVFSYMCGEMATTLSIELAERIVGYVRGAVLRGRTAHPIAALLDLSVGC